MKKILTIAAREYRAMVATKAFLISIIMMPVLMMGGLLATKFLNKAGGIKERKIVVWDGTGKLYDHLNVAADQNNTKLKEQLKNSEDDDRDGFDQIETYVLENVAGKEITDEIRAEMSDKIKSGDIYAFVEIPAGLLKVDKPAEQSASSSGNKNASNAVLFRSENSALAQARGWFRNNISALTQDLRLQASGIDPAVVKKAQTRIEVKGLGLFELGKNGSAEDDAESNPMTAIFLPFGVMMLMFMVIFLAAQPSLESVLEEKSQKIAEVLLGSANTFQLMIGKLLGVVGGSLTVFSIYIVGIIYLAVKQNYDVPFEILPWFVVFQILGVFFFGALFMAVGAAVNQLKEAQSMLLPIWMLMMSPMFVWFVLIRDPNSTIAIAMSMFPPATPTTLMLRMATGQTIPVWQPIVGLIIMIVSTLFVVHIAGRIFRVGILWQGKTPTFREVFKWAFSSQ